MIIGIECSFLLVYHAQVKFPLLDRQRVIWLITLLWDFVIKKKNSISKKLILLLIQVYFAQFI
ncbi:unnamed protein product [Paramecium octaurelia]|uniref:Uncharacterized protein n=1 Tax=Paramecium octaurelia TaxID=43137 RepID=A0A8S1XRL5_PAROT|nr:unnamed protein product [Paramecium octaurelia]